MLDEGTNRDGFGERGASGWSIRLSLPGARGIVFSGERAMIRVALVGPDVPQSTVELRVILTPDLANRQELKHERKLLAGGNEEAFEDVVVPTDEVGYWRIEAQVWESREMVARAVSAVAVVHRPVNYGKDDQDCFFGSMHIRDYEAAQRIGIKLDRIQAYWRFLSRKKANDCIDTLDQAINQARSHGLSVILTVRPEMPKSQRPSWVQWEGDRDIVSEPHIQSYREHVRFLVERYREKLLAIEFLNEPDLMWFQTQGWGIDEAAEIVARLNHEGYRVVKEVAADLPVLGLDMSGVDMLCGLSFTKAVLDRGAKGQFDFYAGHPYTGARYVGDEQNEQWPEDYDLRGVVISAQDLMESYGLSRRYWNTELGWAWQDGSDLLSDTMRRHAAITARALIEARSVPDLEKIIWFEFSGNTLEQGFKYNLVMEHPYLAASAFAAAARLLHHAKPAGAVTILPEISAWRFDCEDDGRTVVALWDDRPGMKLHTQGVDSLEVCDMLGRVVAFGADVEIELSRDPLYYVVPLAHGDRLVDSLRASETTAAQPVAISLARLVDAQTIRIGLENRMKDPVIYDLEIDGKATRSRLDPGVSYHELDVDPPIAAGKPRTLQLSVQTEGFRAESQVACNPIPVRRVSGVVIDGRLDETSGLDAIVLSERIQVMPPDPTVAWNGPDDLSATVWMGWSDEGLYLAARVTDDVHCATDRARSACWLFDSLQVAIDPYNDSRKGYDSNDVEIGVTLAPDGPAGYFWGAGQMRTEHGFPLIVVREDPYTIYELLIPWNQLRVGPSMNGKVLRLNFVFNENDGAGKKCWMGLTGGIVEGKNPEVFREFILLDE